MEDLIDLIATDSTPSEISNAIKDVLYAKAADKISEIRPYVATAIFGENDNEE